MIRRPAQTEGGAARHETYAWGINDKGQLGLGHRWIVDTPELIADLPEGTASAMLKSLSTSGNQPIGEAPSMSAADPPAPGPAPSYSGGTTSSQSTSGVEDNLLVLLFAALCVLGVPGLVIFAIVKGKNK